MVAALGRYRYSRYILALNTKLEREGNELGSVTTQLRFAAPDGKMRLANVMDADQIVALAKAIPNNKSAAFFDWFLYSDNTIDAKSKQKAEVRL